MSEQNPRVGVGVYILNDKRQLLLGKRKNSHGDGSWSPPGGHLEFMESIEECAKREALEETSLVLDNVKSMTFTEDIFDKEKKHYITIHARASIANGSPKVMEHDKCEKWEWFDLDKLPSPLFVSASNFLSTYKDLL